MVEKGVSSLVSPISITMAEFNIFMKSVTMPTAHMDRAVAFYEKLGFAITHGGATSDFTSVKIGAQSHINLVVRGTLRVV